MEDERAEWKRQKVDLEKSVREWEEKNHLSEEHEKGKQREVDLLNTRLKETLQQLEEVDSLRRCNT